MNSAIPLAALYFIAAAAAGGLSVRIARDPSPAARELLGLGLSIVVWATFYGTEILSNAVFFRQLWSQFAYIGVYASTTFLFRFAVRWLRPRRQGWWLELTWVVPAFLVLAVFTNGVHGLVWSEIRPSDTLPHIWTYVRGPAFWVGIVYQYLLIAASVTLIGMAVVTRRGVYRKQALHVLAGVIVAIAGNGIWLLGLRSLPLDITPMALAISTAIVFAGVSRSRLLDLLPTVRHRVADLMPDGLLILDTDFRVIDWNEAALTMWGINKSDLSGMPVSDIVPLWASQIAPELVDPSGTVLRTTLLVDASEENPVYLDVDIRQLSLRAGDADGWIAVFRDASEMRRTERDLQEANERLGSLNKMLLAQAIHDSLTGLFNRAYLDEALPRELARCGRDGSSIALLILDVDNFKNVNDTYGHDIGDLVLKEVARLVRGIVRAGDIPCRFGGDEIVAVMPGAPQSEVAGVAERIRQHVSQERFGSEEVQVAVTVSVGFAIYPTHADSSAELFRAADRALYAAKDAGRNRTLSADLPLSS